LAADPTENKASGPPGAGPPDGAEPAIGVKRLLNLLSLDLGRSPTPYADLAEKLGWTEERTLAEVARLKDEGVIRRLGGVVVHQRAGFTANAMVVWRIEDDRLDAAGRALAGVERVSHCYWRPGVPGWPFNLYTMVHARDQAELLEAVEAMAPLAGAAEWRVLTSLRELKKTSLVYFPGAWD
jgi:DNA-binding Lrp family transcriptional regulator